MRSILAGLDTEYGLAVEGRGAEDQIDDAEALIRSYPVERFLGWDYRFESPRRDLRGFDLERLASDPVDAAFDKGRAPTVDQRADLVLVNGARLYNDHGHPEYATPECWSLRELALHDMAGDRTMLLAASAFEVQTGRSARLFKNNTDFHGASYGTHESYLVPRSVPVEQLIRGLLPLFVARQVLCGAGKVGSDSGSRCEYQMSQRADFFVDSVSAETLYKRPIFNTRDEPHADVRQWMRLHVICGESNRIPSAVTRKVGLVKLALASIVEGIAPEWDLSSPVESVQAVSRSCDEEGRVELASGWTTPREILESYFAAAEPYIDSWFAADIANELTQVVSDCRTLLADRFERSGEFARKVDWAAKLQQLRSFADAEGTGWKEPAMQSIDLAYHELGGQDALFPALVEADVVEAMPDDGEVEVRMRSTFEYSRAFARGLAVRDYREELAGVSWGNLRFQLGDGIRDVSLDPSKKYPDELQRCKSVEEFISLLEDVSRT